MAILTRDQLLAKQELKQEKVKLSTGDVYVRQMNGREKDRFEQSLGTWEMYTEDGTGEQKERYVRTMDDFRAKLAVNTVCDKDGNLLLGPGDVESLSVNMTGVDLMRIADAAQRLNRITEVDRKAMLKNSEGAQGGASTLSSAKH